MYSVTFKYNDPGKPPLLLNRIIPGQSLLEIAIAHSLGLEHECGGMCSCGTCHIYVEQGSEFLEFKSKREIHYLKKIDKSGVHSRLACQCVLLPGMGEIQVILPDQHKI